MPSRRLYLPLALALVAFLSGCAGESSEETRSTPQRVGAKAARYILKRAKPSLGERAAKIALEAVGRPYRWGGASPASGFDCSGLVRWAYGRLGIDVPHSSYALHDLGRPVTRARLEPGDVLFFYGLGHVGLYLGRGRMVHAPQSGRSVEVVTLAGSYLGPGFVDARRLAGRVSR